MADDIFCKIVAGDIPAHKIYEDDDFLAFLEINPIRLGHTLLIPKKHFDTVYMMDDDLYARFFLKAKELAPAIKTATDSDKVGLVVAGFHLDHAHLHLMPTNVIADMDFHNQHPEDAEKLSQMAEKIRGAVNG